MNVRRSVALGVTTLLVAVAPAFAQAPRDGRMLVTVLDQSGAVLPGATVTITGLEDATKAATLSPAKASDKGVATVDRLAPGRYTIQVEFTGFEAGVLKDVRVRAGDNRQTVTLALKRLQDSVTVAQDAQAAAANPRGGSFGSVLTREEINALSDDRAEMARQLQEMAGGNAIIKVDSFTGAPLPPKSQIKSIHIVRDTFPAENHSAENDEIDIVTQPGLGALEGGLSTRVRDGSMSGRSPFTPVKGPERSQTYGGDLRGTLIKEKSSFAVDVSSRRAFVTPNLNAALPTGQSAGILNLKQPNNGWDTYDLFDYALTKDQVFRAAYDHSSSSQENQGVGNYNLAERSYSSKAQDNEIRLQETGPVGRRAFANTRLQIQWADSSQRAALEAQTIRVTDAFTSGGAQVKGGRHSRDFELASDVDYVRGRHSIRSGVLFNGGRYRSDDFVNYLGTFSFTSLADFSAGTPATFTQRIGNPLVEYWNLQGGAYLQDDYRARKSLTVSMGVRYEAQTHLHDYNNVGPRAGITWAPFKSGRTALRASWGVFYNWLNSGTYEQTLRVDGFHQQELTIVDPGYPDPGTGGTVAPTNRYVLGGGLQMARTTRVSAGIDQTLTPKVRVSVLYSHTRAANVLRGVNLNAPVGGVRPDPGFANVIAVTSDARTATDGVQTTLNVNLTPKGAARARWNWRRTTFRMSYFLARSRNNSDGAFSVPASGTLATEWAPASNDRRHRVTASVTSQTFRNLSTTFTFAANTGTPYNITTGLDDNHDLIFNDRPAGVGRNNARLPGQWTLSANCSYAINFGDRKLTFTVSAENLTNHANPTGFSGVMLSPYFQKATAVSSVRRVTLGSNFSF